MFKQETLTYSEMFFHYLKPQVYTMEILKEFERLNAGIEEDQKVLKRLVEQEIDYRARSLKAQKVYLANVKKK